MPPRSWSDRVGGRLPLQPQQQNLRGDPWLDGKGGFGREPIGAVGHLARLVQVAGNSVMALHTLYFCLLSDGFALILREGSSGLG